MTGHAWIITICRKAKSLLMRLVLYYLRVKLQKGPLPREVPPKPVEMEAMSEHLSVLETHQDLESNIIRDTKVDKLLRLILKLKEVPRDAESKFKERCNKLLAVWLAEDQTIDDDEEAEAGKRMSQTDFSSSMEMADGDSMYTTCAQLGCGKHVKRRDKCECG